MNTAAIGLAVTSLVVIFGAVAYYFSTIPRGKVPVRPIGLITFLSIGIGIAVVALFKGYSGSALSFVVGSES
jgi:hypothetical protein